MADVALGQAVTESGAEHTEGPPGLEVLQQTESEIQHEAREHSQSLPRSRSSSDNPDRPVQQLPEMISSRQNPYACLGRSLWSPL